MFLADLRVKAYCFHLSLDLIQLIYFPWLSNSYSLCTQVISPSLPLFYEGLTLKQGTN